MRYKLRRKNLAQNFIYNRILLKRIVGLSSIGPNDIVLDIGAGKGFLTAELAQRAKRVYAIEIDYKLVLHLQKWFADTLNVTIIHRDFLKLNLTTCHCEERRIEQRGNPVRFQHIAQKDIPRDCRVILPRNDISYKVFANIPFNIEGKIVRKLLTAENPPTECYLIVDKRFAQRFSFPGYKAEIIYHFKSFDFIPKPNTDSVLMKIAHLGNHMQWYENISIIY